MEAVLASMRPGRFRLGSGDFFVCAWAKDLRFNEARAFPPGKCLMFGDRFMSHLQASMRPGRFRLGSVDGAAAGVTGMEALQ